ncbi:hypothetical protein [Hymenobacter pini]|uniref:hypothetical protein n=1 Tax=Hymenobacter pini TaxID=2880879 RepID=UPI001CF1F064|nr:hypothetical protein [Hymenobacter pini]MCA8833280.1 hypothetical protein [Hymenobacter pini]
MKNIKNSYFSGENYEFKPFNEHELAMVMGGGGDEQSLDFLGDALSLDDDDDLLTD